MEILSDGLVETEETFILTLSTSEEETRTTLGTRLSHTITINDTDTTSASLVVSNISVPEGEEITISARLSAPSTTSVTLQIDVLLDGNAEFSDYSFTNNRITFAPNQTQSATVRFIALLDENIENQETFSLYISRITSDNLDRIINDTPRTAPLEILLSDPSAQTLSVRFMPTMTQVTEPTSGNTSVSINLVLFDSTGNTRLTSEQQQSTVSITIGTDGTAESGDYSFTSSQTLTSGQVEKAISITVRSDTDTDDESLILSIDGATINNAGRLATVFPPDATITINETAPSVTAGFAAATPATISENAALILSIEVPALTAPRSFRLFSSDVSATSDGTNVPSYTNDYISIDQILQFPTNTQAQTQMVTVIVLNDDYVEGNETVRFNLTLNNSLIDTHLVTIEDNDTATIEFRESTAQAIEYPQNQDILFDVIVSGSPVASGFTSAISAADSTATGGNSCGAGVDYVLNTPSLKFVRNTLDDTASHLFDELVADAYGINQATITLCSDVLYETDETFSLTIDASGLSSISIGSQSDLTITIPENDYPNIVVSLTFTNTELGASATRATGQNTVNANEGNTTNRVITVGMQIANTTEDTTFTVSDSLTVALFLQTATLGSACPQGDFIAPASPFTFSALPNSNVLNTTDYVAFNETYVITLCADEDIEPNEIFILRTDTPEFMSLEHAEDLALTILNDDQVTLSIADVTVNENAATADYTVSLDAPLDFAVSFDLNTQESAAESLSPESINAATPASFNCSSIPNADYVSILRQTLTINSQETRVSGSITLCDDLRVERSEVFDVRISNFSISEFGFIFSDSEDTATITIQNNDTASLNFDQPAYNTFETNTITSADGSEKNALAIPITLESNNIPAIADFDLELGFQVVMGDATSGSICPAAAFNTTIDYLLPSQTTITAGDSSVIIELILCQDTDTIQENPETISLAIESANASFPSGIFSGPPTQITIYDDSTTNIGRLRFSSLNITEIFESVSSLSISLDMLLAQTTQGTITVSTNDETANGGSSCASPMVDYVAIDSQVFSFNLIRTLPSGLQEFRSFLTIPIEICDDSLREGDQTFSLSIDAITIISGSDVSIQGASELSVILIDRQPISIITFNQSTYATLESNRRFSFHFTLSHPLDRDYAFTIGALSRQARDADSVNNLSLANPVTTCNQQMGDYVEIPQTTTLTIRAGETLSPSRDVIICDDDINEDSEYLVLIAELPLTALIESADGDTSLEAVGIIYDNDNSEITAEYSINRTNLTEGDSFMVTVTLRTTDPEFTAAQSAALTSIITDASNTYFIPQLTSQTPGLELSSLENDAISLSGAGDFREFIFSLTIGDNNKVQTTREAEFYLYFTENISSIFSNPVTFTAIGGSFLSIPVTISDNDALSLIITDQDDTPVDTPYAFSATEPSDLASTPDTLALNASLTIANAIVDPADPPSDPSSIDDTVLSSLTLALQGSDTSTLTIGQRCETPRVDLIVESNQIPLNFLGENTVSIPINLDYRSNPALFPWSLEFIVCGDTLIEGNETLTFTSLLVSQDPNVQITESTRSYVLTVIDEDAAVILVSLSIDRIDENLLVNNEVSLELTLQNRIERPISIEWNVVTIDQDPRDILGVAFEGQDFRIDATETIAFTSSDPAGSSRVITITIIDDTFVEGDEQIQLRLLPRLESGVMLAFIQDGVPRPTEYLYQTTIVDNEKINVLMELTPRQITEGQNATILVCLILENNPVQTCQASIGDRGRFRLIQDFLFFLMTRDAASGLEQRLTAIEDDYVPLTPEQNVRIFRFGGNNQPFEFTLQTISDLLIEGNEIFEVVLRSASRDPTNASLSQAPPPLGVSLGVTQEITVQATILDEDADTFDIVLRDPIGPVSQTSFSEPPNDATTPQTLDIVISLPSANLINTIQLLVAFQPIADNLAPAQFNPNDEPDNDYAIRNNPDHLTQCPIDYCAGDSLGDATVYYEFEFTSQNPSHTLGLEILNDSRLEDNESFKILFLLPINTTTFSLPSLTQSATLDPLRSEITLTIIDNDTSIIALAIAPPQEADESCSNRSVGRFNEDPDTKALEICEGSPDLTITVSLNIPIQDETFRLILETSPISQDNQALINQDYALLEANGAPLFEPSAPIELEFIRNQTTTFEYRLSIVDDPFLEGDETFRMELRLAQGQSVPNSVSLQDANRQITIIDNEPRPRWSLTASAPNIGEIPQQQNARQNFTTTLSNSVEYIVGYSPAFTNPNLSISIGLELILRPGVSLVDDFILPQGVTTFTELIQTAIQPFNGVSLGELQSGTSSVRINFTQNATTFILRLTLKGDNRLESQESFGIQLFEPRINGQSGGRLMNVETVMVQIVNDDVSAIPELLNLTIPILLRDALVSLSNVTSTQTIRVLKNYLPLAPVADENGFRLDPQVFWLTDDRRRRIDLLPRLNMWVSGEWTTIDAGSGVTVDGTVARAWSGVDYRLSKNALLGVLAGYETSALSVDAIDNSSLQGMGYGGGLYGGYSFARGNMIFDFSATYHTFEYNAKALNISATLTGQRLMSAAHLSGVWTIDDLHIIPSIGAVWGQETVNNATYELGQLTFGPEFNAQFDFRPFTLEPFIKLTGEYFFIRDLPNAHIGEEGVFAYNPDSTFSGRLHAGLSGRVNGFGFRFQSAYSDILSTQFTSISAGLALYYTLNDTQFQFTTDYQSVQSQFQFIIEQPF